MITAYETKKQFVASWTKSDLLNDLYALLYFMSLYYKFECVVTLSIFYYHSCTFIDVDTSSRPSSTEPNSLENNSSLRRACSLSDLNRPAVTKRLLPAPPGK